MRCRWYLKIYILGASIIFYNNVEMNWESIWFVSSCVRSWLLLTFTMVHFPLWLSPLTNILILIGRNYCFGPFNLFDALVLWLAFVFLQFLLIWDIFLVTHLKEVTIDQNSFKAEIRRFKFTSANRIVRYVETTIP